MDLHTVTDKDGRYRLTGMPRGEGSLIVAQPPKGSSHLGLLQPVALNQHDLEPVTVDFDLRRGVLVKGRVTDKQTGTAVVQAQIEYFVFEDNPWRAEYRDSRFHNYLQTEADGSFEMVVPPGHALIAARATTDRFLVGVGAEKIDKQKNGDLMFLPTSPLCDPMAYHRLLEINPSKDVESLSCNLDLDPGRTLTGTVVDADGKPLAGAKISGLRSYAYTYWENEPLKTAQFTVHALTPDRPRLLEVLHEGKHLAGSLALRGDEKGPVTVKLQPAGTLMGRLVTPSGGPYTRGEMRFGIPQRRDDVTVGTHPLHDIPRDKQGRFRVEGLIPGLKYSLILIPKGNVGKEVTVKPGETIDLGDVKIE
jgi:hypothetical protein